MDLAGFCGEPAWRLEVKEHRWPPAQGLAQQVSAGGAFVPTPPQETLGRVLLLCGG